MKSTAKWKAQAQNVSITRDDWGIAHIKGKRRVDIPALYDTEQYRARIDTIRGKPFFLY